MKIIGVTGNIGSGKSTFCALLSEYGLSVCDCDKIYSETVLSDPVCLALLSKAFDGVVTFGKLDRKKLSAIVFGDEKKLELLNAITHPFVLKHIEKLIDGLSLSGEKAVVVDIPLLFESGFDKKCDVTVAVTAPYEKKIERLKKRSALSEGEIKSRLSKQKSEEFLRENCDVIVENNGDIAKLREYSRELIKTVLQE